MSSYVDELSKEADSKGLIIWAEFPYGAPCVPWPENGDLSGFLDTAVGLGARVVYVDRLLADDGSTLGVMAGFAVGGILHTVNSGKQQSPRPEEWVDGELVDDEDGSDFAEQVSWKEREYRALPEHLRAVADALLADERYEGWNRASFEVLHEHAGELALEDYEVVKEVAERLFQDRIGRRLDHQAERLAPRCSNLRASILSWPRTTTTPSRSWWCVSSV